MSDHAPPYPWRVHPTPDGPLYLHPSGLHVYADPAPDEVAPMLALLAELLAAGATGRHALEVGGRPRTHRPPMAPDGR